MITEKQLKIFTTLAKSPYKELTRQEIKKLSKEKSNNTLSTALTKLKKENLLVEKKVGRSSLFSLNLENTSTYHYIALSTDTELKTTIKTIIKYVKDEVRKTTSFFTLAIFGSYASGEEKTGSDVDLAIIIENKNHRKEIKRNLKIAELKSTIELDIHIISGTDFVEMLSNDEENLGKQIAKKHSAVHNHQLFYDLIQEGIKNGFRIQDLH